MSKPLDHEKNEPADSTLMNSTKLAFTAAGKPAERELSMVEYVDLLKGCIPPNSEQIEAFASYVSSAHSWYKHLPMFPPGKPFHFFLDPWSGMDTVITPERQVIVQERVGESGFHYTWMPTADYREQFGCLNYHTTKGSSFFLPGGIVVNPRASVPTLITPKGAAEVPETVVEASRTFCTGLMHPYTNLPNYWTSPRAGAWQEAEWAEEYGGEALKQRIVRRIENPDEERQTEIVEEERKRRPRRGTRMYLGSGKLCDILAPERQRQLDTMRNAIRRVCDLVWN